MCLPTDLLALIKPLLPPNKHESNQRARMAQMKCRSRIVPALMAVSPAGSAELGVSAGGGIWMAPFIHYGKECGATDETDESILATSALMINI